jgi:hypothetical protein
MAESAFLSHNRLTELLTSVWSAQAGVDILLFQNDLFRRIRRLETIMEKEDIATASGFLDDTKGLIWSGSAEYEALWAELEQEAVDADDEELDELEDVICGWCEETIADELDFFDAALETGELTGEWVGKAAMLLTMAKQTVVKPTVTEHATEGSTVTGQEPSALMTIADQVVEQEHSVTETPSVTASEVPTVVPVTAVHPEVELRLRPKPEHFTRRRRNGGYNYALIGNRRRIDGLPDDGVKSRRIRRTRKQVYYIDK